MKTLRELRKSRRLTMGKLASMSGVSAKTISLYEATPPKRPSRKVISKLAGALDVSPDELLGTIVQETRTKGSEKDMIQGEESIQLDEIHVSRILSLIDREVSELQQLMVDCAALCEDNPALARNIDYISADIDLLMSIKSRFL
ncbi:MAG: helix-turn-helix domain-containing protein [Desulfomonilia bacterium]